MNTTFSEPFIFSVGVKGILNEYTKEEIEKMYPKILDLKELEPGGGTSINPMHDESGSSGRILDAAATNVMASDKSLQSSGNLTNTSTHITSRGKRDKCSIFVHVENLKITSIVFIVVSVVVTLSLQLWTQIHSKIHRNLMNLQAFIKTKSLNSLVAVRECAEMLTHK